LTFVPSLPHRDHEEERTMRAESVLRCAIYARVSTSDQTPDNQLLPLRAFVTARGWSATEYVDHGVSGARQSRPALDAMMKAARSRKVDVILAVRLDRLARSVHHLLDMAKELEALGVALVITEQSIDTTTPTGRFLFTTLGAVAQLERDLIRDRVIAGMQRAKAQGRHLGRRALHTIDPAEAGRLLADGLSLRAVARKLGTHATSVKRAVAKGAAGAPRKAASMAVAG
jgi:DNA invertase Pin-like site-specific DNA recombinase